MAGQRSKGKRSAGTLVKIESPDSPSVFLTLGDLRKASFQGAKFDEYSRTHLNSPIDEKGIVWKEKGFGEKDPGTVTCDFAWTNQDAQDVLEAAEGSEANFEVHFPMLTSDDYPNGYKKTFAALVGAIEENPELGADVVATVVLYKTGATLKVAL